MLERFRSLSAVRIVTYILFFISIVMIAITTVMAFNSFDVLQNWKLAIKGDAKIKAGDRVIIESTYRKVREAGGEAIRYIECRNRDNVWLRYELNRRDANRLPTEKGGTGVDVVVRDDIPDLPTKCKFSISICYDTIIPGYCHQEANSTEEFTLYPAAQSSAKSESDESQKTSQTQAPIAPVTNPSVDSIASSSQSTPPAAKPQQQSSQETPSRPESSPPEEPEPICEPVLTVPLLGTLYCRYG